MCIRDRSTTFTMNFGENNQNIFYALEYWRFLELTGHPFRVNSVSNTKGLFSSLRYLANYYSHWSLMQILIASCLLYTSGDGNVAAEIENGNLLKMLLRLDDLLNKSVKN